MQSFQSSFSIFKTQLNQQILNPQDDKPQKVYSKDRNSTNSVDDQLQLNFKRYESIICQFQQMSQKFSTLQFEQDRFIKEDVIQTKKRYVEKGKIHKKYIKKHQERFNEQPDQEDKQQYIVCQTKEKKIIDINAKQPFDFGNPNQNIISEKDSLNKQHINLNKKVKYIPKMDGISQKIIFVDKNRSKDNLDERPDRFNSNKINTKDNKKRRIYHHRILETEDDLKEIQLFYQQYNKDLKQHNPLIEQSIRSFTTNYSNKINNYNLNLQNSYQIPINLSQQKQKYLSQIDNSYEYKLQQSLIKYIAQPTVLEKLQSTFKTKKDSSFSQRYSFTTQCKQNQFLACEQSLIIAQKSVNNSSQLNLLDNSLLNDQAMSVKSGDSSEINLNVDNIHGYNDDSFDDDQYGGYFDEQIQQERICIQQFILDNQRQLKRYKLKKNTKMKNRFINVGQYMSILKELNKYQIIQHVNQTIEMITQETYQKEIKIIVAREYIEDKKKNVKKQCICVHPYDRQNNEEQNKYALQQAVDRGKVLGIITYNIPFQMKHLKQSNASLCFIEKKSQKIFLTGIEDSETIPSHPLYFINLDSIITHLRQYQAILAVDVCHLSNQIIGNKNLKSHDKERLYLLQTEIFRQIKSKRNLSQVQTIQNICINKEGIFLIQGPPGTGKTETIVNMVSLQYEHYQKMKKASLILICAQSNAAVNHIGRKLLREGLIGSKRKPTILRLGNTTEYDQNLLSINLSHQAEIKLLKNHSLYDEFKDNLSAKLRSQKESILQKIYKLTLQKKFNPEYRELKKKYRQIISKLSAIHKVIGQFYEEYQNILEQILVNGEIILSTLNTCGKWKFLQHFKDHVGCLIIDEAGQATEPSTLIPMQCNSDKVVLVGDHKQLKPTVMSRNCQLTGYSTSLLERLIKAGLPCKMLDTQYRMIPLLRQFPSKQFYNNQLKDGRLHKIPQSLAKISRPCLFINLSFGKQEIFKKSYQNIAQAEAIFFLMQKLIRVDPTITIGVIAPYKSQVKLIQNKFQEYNYPQKIVKNVKISTVDAFQGQQMDVILISCVRSNDKRNIGFVKDEKRMNVSITRAKYCLFVFGNCDTLASSKHWKNYINFHRDNKSLIDTNNRDNLIHVLRTYI